MSSEHTHEGDPVFRQRVVIALLESTRNLEHFRPSQDTERKIGPGGLIAISARDIARGMDWVDKRDREYREKKAAEAASASQAGSPATGGADDTPF